MKKGGHIKDNQKEVFDYAIKKAFTHRVDELGTKNNPNFVQRKRSQLSYEEALDLILNADPHCTYYLRTMEPDWPYYEFGVNNTNTKEFGSVFIWIECSIEEGLKIIEKFNL